MRKLVNLLSLKRIFRHRRKAFTLVELVIAIAISSVLLASAMLMFNLVNRFWAEHGSDTFAGTVQQELVEQLSNKLGRSSSVNFYALSDVLDGTAVFHSDYEKEDILEVKAMILAQNDEGFTRLYDMGVLTESETVTVPDMAHPHFNWNREVYELRDIFESSGVINDDDAVDATPSVLVRDKIEEFSVFDEPFYDGHDYRFSFLYENKINKYLMIKAQSFENAYSSNPDDMPTTETLLCANKMSSFKFFDPAADVSFQGCSDVYMYYNDGGNNVTVNVPRINTEQIDASANTARGDLVIVYVTRKIEDEFDANYSVYQPGRVCEINDIIYYNGKQYRLNSISGIDWNKTPEQQPGKWTQLP